VKPIKITAGPTIKKFCDCFGVEEEEAVQWVHSYVNRPSDWDMLTGLYEATPSLRYESTLGDKTKKPPLGAFMFI
jgi:hypothetical protein